MDAATFWTAVLAFVGFAVCAVGLRGPGAGPRDAHPRERQGERVDSAQGSPGSQG
jgi:hypothetical protein